MFYSALNGNSNVDTMSSGGHGRDTIVLDTSIFHALGTTFDASEFRGILTGTSFAAVDDTDHIIYVRQTGRLSCNVDGSGDTARTLFSIIDPGRSLTIALGDFDLIA